jgi:hypothetical protein
LICPLRVGRLFRIRDLSGTGLFRAPPIARFAEVIIRARIAAVANVDAAVPRPEGMGRQMAMPVKS